MCYRTGNGADDSPGPEYGWTLRPPCTTRFGPDVGVRRDSSSSSRIRLSRPLVERGRLCIQRFRKHPCWRCHCPVIFLGRRSGLSAWTACANGRGRSRRVPMDPDGPGKHDGRFMTRPDWCISRRERGGCRSGAGSGLRHACSRKRSNRPPRCSKASPRMRVRQRSHAFVPAGFAWPSARERVRTGEGIWTSGSNQLSIAVLEKRPVWHGPRTSFEGTDQYRGGSVVLAAVRQADHAPSRPC